MINSIFTPIHRALIVDDLPHCRAWLERAVRAAFESVQVHIAANLAEGVITLSSIDNAPDLLLLDLDLGDGNGLELIRILKLRNAKTHIVVATVFDDDAHLFPALRMGADGYVLKDESQENLVVMLKLISQGQPPLSASIARRLLRHFSPTTDIALPSKPEITLSEREVEVLTLTGKGYSVPKVGELLHLSKHTVAGYVKEIYRKLGISSRAEAALEANKRGFA